MGGNTVSGKSSEGDHGPELPVDPPGAALRTGQSGALQRGDRASPSQEAKFGAIVTEHIGESEITGN